jgi:hypothetical protein
VEGRHHPLALGNDAALALRSGDDAVDRFRQFVPADCLLVAASSQDRRLVNQVL